MRMRSPASLLAIALGAAALLAGCAGPPAAAPTPSRTPASPSAAAATPDDGAVMTEEYARLASIDARVQLTESDRGVGVPWAVVTLDRGSRTLYIGYVAGSEHRPRCGHHLGAAVVETAATVTISVRSSFPKDLSGCTDEPVIRGGAIELREPLGARTLLHGRIDAPWDDGASPLPTRRPAPTPSVAPLPPAYAGPATCEGMLAPATARRLESAGLHDESTWWRDDVISQAAILTLDYSVLRWGGLVCRRDDRGTRFTTWSWSPITASDAAATQRQLDADPTLTKTTADGEVRYALAGGASVGTAGSHADYAFGDGFWVSSLGEGAESVIDDVLARHP